MCRDAGQAVDMTYYLLIQSDSHLVSNLSAVRAPRAGEYGDFLGFTLAGYGIAFLRLTFYHSISSFLY
jgi:hypothetical protein